MIRIAICEDNKEDCAYIQDITTNLLKEISVLVDLHVFHSAEEMCEVVEDLNFDIVFLDIYMKNMTGMELAQKIRENSNKTLIVFCTHAEEHAIEGYQCRAFHYLVKPLHKHLLEGVLIEALKHLELHRSIQYALPSDKGMQVICLEDIYYIESDIRKTTIHLKGEAFTCNYNINTLEQKLETFGFIRSHRSYIVNSLKIRSIECNAIQLKNGESVLLSKYKTKEVKKKVVDLLGGIL